MITIKRTNDDLLFLHKKGDFWNMDAICFPAFSAYVSHYFQHEEELTCFSDDRIIHAEIRQTELTANKALFKWKYIGQDILLLTFLEPKIVTVERSDKLTVGVRYLKKECEFHGQKFFQIKNERRF